MNAPPQLLRDRLRDTLESPSIDNHPVSAAGVDNPTSLEHRQPSLPILEAFQEFLEAERRQSRRRLLTFITFFLLILALALTSAGIVGYRLVHDLHHDIRVARTAANTTADASKREAEEVRDALNHVSANTKKSLRRVTRERKSLKRSLSRLGKDLTKQTQEFNALTRLVSSLEAENSKLKGDLASVATKMNNLVQPPPTTTETKTMETSTIAMSVTPRGTAEAVPWRIPIPE